MRIDDLNVHVFQNRDWRSPKSPQWIFFLFWLSEDPSLGKILSEKENGATGLLSEKMEALHSELNERAEAATCTYSAGVDFLQYIYSVLVTKNHLKISSRCFVHEFSFTNIF